MTTFPRFVSRLVILLMVLASAMHLYAVDPPVPENPLLTKNYKLYGETAEMLLDEAMFNAVASGTGQLYFSPYMLRARNLLSTYLERNAEKFIPRYHINENEVRGGQRYLDVDVVVDLEKLYADLNAKKFIYEPAYRPVFYLFMSETFDERAVSEPLARKMILTELDDREYRYLWTSQFKEKLLRFAMAAAWSDGIFKQSEMEELKSLVFNIIPEIYGTEWKTIINYLEPSLDDIQRERLRLTMWNYAHSEEEVQRMRRLIPVEQPMNSSDISDAFKSVLNATISQDQIRQIESILRLTLMSDGEISTGAEKSLLDSSMQALDDFEPNYLALEANIGTPSRTEDQSDNLKETCKQAQRYGIEIFITGSVKSKTEKSETYYFDKINFVTTNVQLHLVRSDTCEILTTVSSEISASSADANQAKNESVKAAVEKALPELLETYDKTWGKTVLVEQEWGPEAYRKETLLKLMAVGMSPERVSALRQKMQTLAPPEAEVYTRATFNDIAVLCVSWNGSEADVVEMMRQTQFPEFVIKQIAPYSYMLEVVD